MKRFALLTIALGAIFAVGCAAKTEDAGSTDSGTKSEAPDTKSSSNAPEGKGTQADGAGTPVAYTGEDGKLLCPVMKKPIDSPEKAVSYQDYKGKRYYFCCGMCPGKFKENPELYAKAN